MNSQQNLNLLIAQGFDNIIWVNPLKITLLRLNRPPIDVTFGPVEAHIINEISHPQISQVYASGKIGIAGQLQGGSGLDNTITW